MDSKQAAAAARIPARVTRHSSERGVSLDHGACDVRVAAVTAFLPKVGYQFPWVNLHWIAGIVLTISVIYHIIHASFVLDFWSIWPDKAGHRGRVEADEAGARASRACADENSGKYPLENKLYPSGGAAGGAFRDRHGPLHDEARAHAVLHAQSVSLQRYDLGLDVRAARSRGRRIRCARHGAHLLRRSGRKNSSSRNR